MNLIGDPLRIWEQRFESELRELVGRAEMRQDPAHDLLHFRRVVATAKHLANCEHGKLEIVIPAAWLHDFVIVPKNDPRRTQASRLSAEAALDYLKQIGYPAMFFDEIAHAIEAHSFSAGIEAETLEAKIVQDADRLDGLGAIGIARCFATAGIMGRPFYSEYDPFCETREPNDSAFTVDHFFKKLFKVAETLHTSSGREEGRRRVATMKQYLQDLSVDIRS
jgi:uncharacterized protein